LIKVIFFSKAYSCDLICSKQAQACPPIVSV
jgi:hypothetical protein